MKKIAATLCLLATAAVAFGQGTVVPANTSSSTFRTNSTATGGTSGNATGLGGFYFEVLTAPSGVTTVDASLQQLLSAPWSDTGIGMTNTSLGGRTSSSVGSPAVANNWGAGNSNSFIVVGWSVNEGTTWAQVAAKLQGAHFNGSMWDAGPNLVNNGFVGATVIGVRAAGLPDGTGAPGLFGAAADTQGVPVIGPSTLFVVNIPEPSTFALGGLGLAALGIFRRRK